MGHDFILMMRRGGRARGSSQLDDAIPDAQKLSVKKIQLWRFCYQID
jgi:hypothetical protein